LTHQMPGMEVVASRRNARVAAKRMGLTMGERRAVTRATARRYQAADRAGKKVILDDCAS